MGGSALLIYGAVSEQLLQPRPARRSVLDRLIGRTRTTTPEWSQLGRNRRMIDLPTDGLDVLGREFRDHVRVRFDKPWAATTAVIEYLGVGVTSVHLRGDQEGDEPPNWYVQLNFSGCAGMAQVASELCAHWAEKWFVAERDRITTSILRPHGFEPDERTEAIGLSAVFVPVGVAGYAQVRQPPDDSGFDTDRMESRYFEVDASPLENLSDAERSAAMRKLDDDLAPLVGTEQCSCQWCAPTLDIAAVDRVVPFK